ncbi:toprim domain-containing protein [Actinoplanes regularis]|uniref:toprim domain-containing protein n=1 Tax=Actinoplanes regularis TaxID=52697 RepID=UPI0024A468AC|nr:toprim domain-containing protein [Actinoplanes regularis]GLW34458.1 hypothetical protein Areg01_73950 [Actinoplanes regularis]
MTAAVAPAAGPDLGRLRAATAAAVDFYRVQLARTDRLHTYLQQRQLQALVNRAQPWQIGHAPAGWQTLTRHLRSAGFTDDELVAAGLCHRDRTDRSRLYDVFRDRLVFPIRDQHGPVGFTGRATPHAPPDVPKYVNTAATALYDKSALLFGLAEQHERIARGWPIALVEGPTDVLACWLSYARSDEPGVVALAPCGTALTDTQAAIVCRLPGAQHAIIVAFDGDNAGRTAITKAWQLLHARHPSRLLRAAALPPGTDPAALLARPNGRAQVRAVLHSQTRPLLDAVVDHRLNGWLTRWPRLLEDVDGRCHAARGLVDLMFEADDREEAVRVARQIVRRTRVHPEVITQLTLEHVEAALAEATATANRPGRSGPGPPAPAPAPAQAFPPLHLLARQPARSPSGAPSAPARPGPTTRSR